jgi:hypothetical protein
MRSLFFTAALLLLVVQNPAYAGWENTDWGMTREEVMAATGGDAREPREADWAEFSGFIELFFEPSLVMNDALSGHDVLVLFRLEQDRLTEVALMPSRDGQQACDILFVQWQDRLGEPEARHTIFGQYPREHCRLAETWQHPQTQSRVTYENCSLAIVGQTDCLRDWQRSAELETAIQALGACATERMDSQDCGEHSERLVDLMYSDGGPMDCDVEQFGVEDRCVVHLVAWEDKE